jgi:hypothetical protein
MGMVLRNLPVIEGGDPYIQENVKNKGEVEKGVVPAIDLRPNSILHGTVYPEHPERLDQNVEKKKKGQVGDELPFQSLSKLRYFTNLHEKYQLHKLGNIKQMGDFIRNSAPGKS